MTIEIVQDLWVKRFDERFPTPWLDHNTPRWELVRDFIILYKGVELIVPQEYVFNGSSVPRMLWTVYPPSYPPAWRGSCVHDFGLSHGFDLAPQSYWDDILRDFILFDGGSNASAWLFHKSVGLSPRGGYKNAALSEPQ